MRPAQPAASARLNAASCSQIRPVGHLPACSRPGAAAASRPVAARAAGDAPTMSVREVAELIAMRPLADDQKESLSTLAAALEVPVGTAKQLAYKRRALLGMSAAEIKEKIAKVAAVVGVSPAQAREMALIQPALLVDTERQAETLQLGIRAICYELNAPKEEVVQLILRNQSVLHGREMHLSVSDIAHLAMLREPRGRIVD